MISVIFIVSCFLFSEPMQFIRLRVLGGRGFTNEILEEEDCSGSTQSHFVLHCQFAGQRLSSNPVPCSTQPNFRHDFIFAMPAVGSLKAAFKKRSSMSYHHGDESAHHDQEPSCSAADLLDIHDVLHIVLTRISPNTDAVLQSSHNMQWRNVSFQQLLIHKVCLSVEMQTNTHGRFLLASLLLLRVSRGFVCQTSKPRSRAFLFKGIFQVKLSKRMIASKEDIFFCVCMCFF